MRDLESVDINGAMRETARLVCNGMWSMDDGINSALTRLVRQADTWCPAQPPPVQLATIRMDLRHHSVIPRHGDLLVGFVLIDDDAEPVTLQVSGQGGAAHGPPLQIRSGSGAFKFALDDRFAIPLINLRFHEVTVVGSRPAVVGVVYALLDTVERRHVCFRGAYARLDSTGGSFATWKSGTGVINNNATHGDECEFLDMRRIVDELFEEERRRSCVAQCAVLRKDLMEAAWLPTRMRAWCLEHDDEFAVQRPAADGSPTEVRVVDAFLTAGECASVLSAGDGQTPRLLDDIPGVRTTTAMLAARLDHAAPWGRPWSVHGGVTFGDSSDGMHAHRDEAYQIPASVEEARRHTLLIYLTDVAHGGATVFSSKDVVHPRAGRAALFSVRHLHWGEPVLHRDRERKLVLACEVTRGGAACPPDPLRPSRGMR